MQGASGAADVEHLDERYEVFAYAGRGQLLADLAQRLHRLIAHDGLLHLRQLLQRLQQRVPVRWTADVGHKLAEFFGHRQQHFVLIIIVLDQKGQQLRAGALLA